MTLTNFALFKMIQQLHLLAWVLPFAGFPVQALHVGVAASTLSCSFSFSPTSCRAPASTRMGGTLPYSTLNWPIP